MGKLSGIAVTLRIMGRLCSTAGWNQVIAPSDRHEAADTSQSCQLQLPAVLQDMAIPHMPLTSTDSPYHSSACPLQWSWTPDGAEEHAVLLQLEGHLSCIPRAGSATSLSYRRFKFASCQPSTAAAAVRSADELAAGRIQLDVCEVVMIGHKTPLPGQNTVPRKSADKRLPEGKKWFMAPGLKVSMAVPTVQLQLQYY